jgi:D-sedoheptulose 7-phosphate isomerase
MEKQEKSKKILAKNFADFLECGKQFSEIGEEAILNYSKMVIDCISDGGKVLWCGNGGSAAESQHMAAELMGRFNFDREPISSMALTTDTSFITGVSNDIDFNEIFARQVSGLGTASDLLVAISTSGNSENVFRAVIEAKQKGMTTVGLLGGAGGKIATAVDFSIIVASNVTPRIQELHTFINHCMCELVEYNLNGL